MKIKIAQMRVKALDVKANYLSMMEIIQQTQNDVEILVFPRNALLGTMHGDRIENKYLIQDVLYYQEKIRVESTDFAIVWGGLDYLDDELYECIHFCRHQEIKKIYKRSLNDSVYHSESKYYDLHRPNQNLVILKGRKISFSYFDDFIPVPSDLNIVIDSSYWYQGIEEKRLEKVESYEEKVLYVNHVGMQNTGNNVFVYDGASFYFDREIGRVQIASCFEEEAVVVDVDAIERQKKCDAHHYNALLSLIRWYDDEIFPFKPMWIVGLSGGLDSAVSLGLLSKALGNKRVLAVTMPSKYNQSTSKNNAKKMASALSVELLEVPIEQLAQVTLESLDVAGIDASEGLAYENIQARLRGHILMSISSVRNGVIMNNGNKLESAFGYATMYGDAIGALSILGDLTKLEVSAIAEAINNDYKQEIIPYNLIAKISKEKIEWDFAPSAELRDDQTDPMKWGYHDHLLSFILKNDVEKLLEMYDNGTIYDTDFGDYLKVYGLDDPQLFIEDLDWVIRQLYGSIYKRIQMPPIAVMSETAFGTGKLKAQYAHIPTKTYEAYRTKILEK
ncbi:NAD(+) synthase [Erysipelothrix urinaevulpis]|uniref:NAD(+) synthase n=1 Tax=Erysipelothrix urinaevulpis TaxID=2683717 RepID=UPI00135CBBA5|nr:NAD(+) synthase [Erysipelothrix urinaevulpis]